MRSNVRRESGGWRAASTAMAFEKVMDRRLLFSETERSGSAFAHRGMLVKFVFSRT
jgi:hypothetical protein